MSKHTQTSLGKLSQEELQKLATELSIKFQENDTKPMLVNGILYVQLVAEHDAIKTELKELKAQPNLTEELAEANKVIEGQTAKIEELEAKLSEPTTVVKEKEAPAEVKFVKVGNKEFTLNPKLKEVLLDGNIYTREEALEDSKVMGKLAKNSYPHLVKK